MKASIAIKLAGWTKSWGTAPKFEFVSVKAVVLGFGLEISLGAGA